MPFDNGVYKKFTGLVEVAKKVENGIVKMFQLKPGNVFSGDEVVYDLVQKTRSLPKAKHSTGGYTTNKTDKFRNLSFSPPAYKEQSNYAMGQVENRQAGTLVTDELDKTSLLMSKTASDVAYILETIEFGMILQAVEIFQHGKIRFKSVYGYEVDDIDFNCPATNFATVGTVWSNIAALALSDIDSHVKVINNNGMTRVDNIAFGADAFAAFTSTTQVKEELDNRRIDKGNITHETIQMDGMQRVGVFNFSGTNVALWTYDEFYQTVNERTGAITGTVPFLDTDKVIFWASKGDYQVYFAGISTIKKVPESLRAFLPSPNITIMGDRVATDVYIDTKEVSNGDNEGVYLRGASRPLLVPRTNATFGRLTVL